MPSYPEKWKSEPVEVMVVVKDEEVDAFIVQRASVIYQSRDNAPTFKFLQLYVCHDVFFFSSYHDLLPLTLQLSWDKG